METLGERVAREREAKGWTQAELAGEVTKRGFRIGQSAIGNIESGRSRDPKCVVQLAEALSVSARWLQTGKGQKDPPEIQPIQSNASDSDLSPEFDLRAAAEEMKVPASADWPRDVPVLGTSVGGVDGEFSLNGETIDYVRRPPRLKDRVDVFCLYVIGDSMSPWRRSNGLIYVERQRAPSIGDHVVVELKPTNGSEERPALVKKLVGLTGSKVRLEQYNPRKIFEIDRRRVERLYRVMDYDELLGI